ncbi:MAG: D-aminoacyl-tRNA deacylase [Methanobacteriota archaeon]|nr:MAG: D-aminoacyl-tRNA deacylase [Euryarchaeota archaeon]
MNIRKRLIERRDWNESGSFADNPVLTAGDYIMVGTDRIHLLEDHIDGRVADVTGRKIDVTIFASRHSAASGIPTLTVHPIGNYSTAEFGGESGRLPPASPQIMTEALRILRRRSEGMEFKVSFETTHHGPLTDGPAFFIEIGSDEGYWEREDASDAIADTILSIEETRHPAIVCVGGGHYAPRFTDLALSRKVAIGHMAANYALESLDDEMIGQMASASMAADKVYFNKKGMPKPKYRELRGRFASCGISEISSDDLEPL